MNTTTDYNILVKSEALETDLYNDKTGKITNRDTDTVTKAINANRDDYPSNDRNFQLFSFRGRDKKDVTKAIKILTTTFKVPKEMITIEKITSIPLNSI